MYRIFAHINTKQILKIMKTEEIKKMILQGETFDITTNSDDMINIWHHKKWGCDMFVLEFNGKVIKSSKHFITISKKFNELNN